MDAGVPVKRPVAGIAMGLIKEGDALLSCLTFLAMKTILVTWIQSGRFGRGCDIFADGY